MNNPFFTYFRYYKSIAGSKLYIFILLSFFASLLDGLGVTAMLPLISLDFSGETRDDYISMLFSSIFSFLQIVPSVKAILILILLIFFLKFLFSFSQMGVSSYISAWLVEHLKRKYAIAYNRMRYKYFVSTNIGYFNNIVTTETGFVVNGFKKLVEVCVFFSNLFAYLLFSFIINWRLTLFVIFTGLVLHLSYKKIRSTVANVSYEKTKVNAKVQNVIIQYVSNYKYLKATANGVIYLKHLFPLLHRGRVLDFKNQIYNNFTATTFDFFRVLLLIVAIFYMVEIRGEKVAEVFVPLALLARSFGMALNMQVRWQNFISMTGSISALQEAWEKLEVNTEPSGDIEFSQYQKAISLKNVIYAYGKNQVLKDISLEIGKGRCIGVAGPSGAGKTTLIDIITGLLEPTDGKIFLDDVDYRDIKKDSLRSLFGYVTQEPIIFNDTIENNISFWDSSQDKKEKLQKAINLAGCSGFVSEIPEMEQTIVGDKGVKLSGGQRQRISIAREIYLDSEILVFDEATASLDSETEHFIQDSIEKLLGLKTIIIIAHRLSTLKICDEIIVLKDGAIEERGAWDDLLQQGSIFSEMCAQQGINQEDLKLKRDD